MYNWKNLNEDYGEVWDRFDTKFNFQPSYHERRVPAISEPSPSVTFDLPEDLSEAALDEVTVLLRNAFRLITPRGGNNYFLDWQHNSYRFDPHELDDDAFCLWYPDGDYFIFLTEDFSCGTFGHPWQLSLCVFGAPLLSLVCEPLRMVLPVLRESNSMPPPPMMIDNAVVLWWAAADEPFGLCGDVPVYGFAVCRYESGEIYRFSCNHKWETVQDSDYADIETAKQSLPLNYSASKQRIVWHQYGP